MASPHCPSVPFDPLSAAREDRRVSARRPFVSRGTIPAMAVAFSPAIAACLARTAEDPSRA